MNTRWIVLGAGYAGARLARELAAEDADVWATVRDIDQAIELERDGVASIVADFEGAVLQSVDKPKPAIAVLSIPPSRVDHHSKTEANALAWAKAQGATRAIYWSSTGVYGASNGALVDESTPTAPDTPVGQRRAAAEARVIAAAEELGLELAIVRIVGIYGPHRNMKQRLERGDYVMADDGRVWSNRVHVDDIASATRWIAEQEPIAGVWLLSDGENFQVRDLVSWLCAELGLPMVGSVPLAEMDQRRQAFWSGNRRTQPKRLFESGWRPRYPDYKQGTHAAWDEEAADEETAKNSSGPP